ncbi:MAG: hypothetical protein GEU90_00530 [Gemmatimonas sp.]|nr:hypothetical protein [Gemmatimonas sp.]
MTSMKRVSAALAFVFAAACNDVTGLGEYEGVRVVAEIDGRTSIAVLTATVHNGSAVPITRYAARVSGLPYECPGPLHRYKGFFRWEYADYTGVCLAIGVGPFDTIAPGERRVLVSRDISGFDPGVYRFGMNLRGSEGDLLPERARISNTFRVE